jgi:hypothetical protein
VGEVGFDKAKPNMKLGPPFAVTGGALSSPVAEAKRESDKKCRSVGRSHFGRFICARDNKTTIGNCIYDSRETKPVKCYRARKGDLFC